jgi:hypothetical protein
MPTVEVDFFGRIRSVVETFGLPVLAVVVFLGLELCCFFCLRATQLEQ